MSPGRNASFALFVLMSTLAACGALSNSSDGRFPELSIEQVKTTGQTSFDVTGYVIVVLCPRFQQCVSPDGVYVSREYLSPSDRDGEAMREWAESDSTVFLGSDGLRRFNFREGQRYRISYTRGKGVVGATALK